MLLYVLSTRAKRNCGYGGGTRDKRQGTRDKGQGTDMCKYSWWKNTTAYFDGKEYIRSEYSENSWMKKFLVGHGYWKPAGSPGIT
jgi:hypothetical protein